MKLGEIASLLDSGAGNRSLASELASELMDREPFGYSIDSRTLRNGELFFAIRGDIHDGHRFVGAALRSGAIAAIVDKAFFAAGDHSIDRSGHSRLIYVDNTLEALQALASCVITFWGGCEIAITGSSGKT